MGQETGRAIFRNRNVLALGWVSLLNDFASEMAYPIIPIFLTATLGAPVAAVGLIEGTAEATASLVKVFSGWTSDRLRNRKGFVAAGYLFGSMAKVLLAFAASWSAVLGARFLDRFGKGIRSAARDALIADSTEPGTRGAAFGLHRAMDTVGAIIGPLTALLLLALLSGNYALFFLIASVPAFLGVAVLVLFVREPAHDRVLTPVPFTLSLSQFGAPFKGFLLVSLLFTLGNSSDAFLILRSQHLGSSTQTTVLLYVLFNVVYSLLSYPFGRLSDRFGARRVLIASLFLFAVVYAGFAAAETTTVLWLLFPAYGVFMAMNEGVGKAYIAGLVPADQRGTAIGLFYTATGLVTFFSSVIAGLLWKYAGVPAPFYAGACLAALAGIIFWILKK